MLPGSRKGAFPARHSRVTVDSRPFPTWFRHVGRAPNILAAILTIPGNFGEPFPFGVGA
jgi:hypothetical protein